jgi:hypothetical protein
MSIPRTKIESSNLEAIEYDGETQTLLVEFKNKSLYSYALVPAELATGLLNAPESEESEHSAGKFFNKKIKAAKFTYVKVLGVGGVPVAS